MKYEIEYAQFTKVTIEAKNKAEANDIASTLDWEEIKEHDTHEYFVWDINEVN